MALPQARLPVLNSDNTFTLPWLRFFQQLTTGSTIDPAIIAELEAQIAHAEAIAANALTVANNAETAVENVEFGLTTLSLLGVSALDEHLSKISLTAPSILTVDGSPVYNVGTLSLTLATQSANLIFAGPSTGAAATPTFRSLVTADLPGRPTTFAGLAATPVDSQPGFITDGSVVAAGNFGTIAAGGGANHVPVYYDAGTSNWRIG